MRNTLFILIFLFSFTFCSAQTPYLKFADEKNKDGIIYKGMISKYILENEYSFDWYIKNNKSYLPETALINGMESVRDSIQFIIFGGTWCDDTQLILPHFFKIQEMSGFPDSAIVLFGVDRNKKTMGNLSEAFSITNVPTIIAMKNGKELGRVVEYGKDGDWENSLRELLH